MQNIAVIFLCSLLQACAFSVPSYQTSNQNQDVLKGATAPLSVVYEKPAMSEARTIGCRAAGPVKVQNGETFPSYVIDALRSELDAAGRLSPSGKPLSVSFDKIDFSTALGATNWYINATYSIGDKQFPVVTVYSDRSSYAAVKACANIALYYAKAVDQHLNQLFSHNVFQSEVGYIDRNGSQQNTTLESRLRQLKRLFDEGLITDEDYDAKRAILIDEL
jgi:hypothetical protein